MTGSSREALKSLLTHIRSLLTPTQEEDDRWFKRGKVRARSFQGVQNIGLFWHIRSLLTGGRWPFFQERQSRAQSCQGVQRSATQTSGDGTRALSGSWRQRRQVCRYVCLCVAGLNSLRKLNSQQARQGRAPWSFSVCVCVSKINSKLNSHTQQQARQGRAQGAFQQSGRVSQPPALAWQNSGKNCLRGNRQLNPKP
jgi:hypothetical protein